MSSKPSKQAQQRAEQEQKRKQQQYLIIGGAVLAALLVVGGVFLLLNQRPGATSTVCGNLRILADEGQGHLKEGEAAPAYKSVPPTSGTHNPIPLPAGVYDTNVDVTQLVHSLEHGYIVLYHNGLSQDELNQLVSVQRSDPFKVIVAPYPNMPYRVAIAAWTHLQTCEGVNDAAIRSFTAQFRNQGPEQAP